MTQNAYFSKEEAIKNIKCLYRRDSDKISLKDSKVFLTPDEMVVDITDDGIDLFSLSLIELSFVQSKSGVIKELLDQGWIRVSTKKDACFIQLGPKAPTEWQYRGIKALLLDMWGEKTVTYEDNFVLYETETNDEIVEEINKYYLYKGVVDG